MDIDKLAKYHQRKAVELQAAKESLRTELAAVKASQTYLDGLLEAQRLVQTAAATVQNAVHERIASVVSRCLNSVLDEPCSLEIRFEKKRGKTEANIVFIDGDGNETNPTEEDTGGGVDLAAFALRLVALLLKKPKARKLLVLDEPFKHLSRDLRPKVKLLLEALSDELDFQFLIVTHDPLLVAGDVIEL